MYLSTTLGTLPKSARCDTVLRKMMFFRLTGLLSLLATCVLVQVPSSVFAAPTESAYESLDHEARDLLARATPAAPYWVVYNDDWLSSGLPSASTLDVSDAPFYQCNMSDNTDQGFNVLQVVTLYSRVNSPLISVNLIASFLSSFSKALGIRRSIGPRSPPHNALPSSRSTMQLALSSWSPPLVPLMCQPLRVPTRSQLRTPWPAG